MGLGLNSRPLAFKTGLILTAPARYITIKRLISMLLINTQERGYIKHETKICAVSSPLLWSLPPGDPTSELTGTCPKSGCLLSNAV